MTVDLTVNSAVVAGLVGSNSPCWIHIPILAPTIFGIFAASGVSLGVQQLLAILDSELKLSK